MFQIMSLWGGVPAKVIESIDQYYVKLHKASLHVGHLSKVEKDKALKKIYNYGDN